MSSHGPHRPSVDADMQRANALAAQEARDARLPCLLQLLYGFALVAEGATTSHLFIGYWALCVFW